MPAGDHLVLPWERAREGKENAHGQLHRATTRLPTQHTPRLTCMVGPWGACGVCGCVGKGGQRKRRGLPPSNRWPGLHVRRFLLPSLRPKHNHQHDAHRGRASNKAGTTFRTIPASQCTPPPTTGTHKWPGKRDASPPSTLRTRQGTKHKHGGLLPTRNCAQHLQPDGRPRQRRMDAAGRAGRVAYWYILGFTWGRGDGALSVAHSLPFLSHHPHRPTIKAWRWAASSTPLPRTVSSSTSPRPP